MKRLLLALLLAAPAYGKELHVLDLDQFYFQASKIYDHRDANYQYESGLWRFGSAIGFDLDLISYGDYGLFWRNEVVGKTAGNQYRSVHWRYDLGFQLSEKVEIFWAHLSTHTLDEMPVDTGFGLTNEAVIRVNFYKRKER